ncbi:hypothetical protein SAMN04488127_1075 [Bhargavaea ginsengi]|uniref:Uncharacterized protein n=1 Tax=Bhargavaea ginsengi TaxID=426757 RepID=A0A1H6W9P5_9BACL|nr:hypothetical protein [Bhargavaea ginsengi]SEJ13741.1 hypothetical protein SAMN04488127_1075 [Bhargavaea ginsengi]
MYVSDRIMYLFSGLIVLSLVGMFLQSWRLILYPYLVVIGVAITIGIWKAVRNRPALLWVPISVAGGYIVLFVTLDLITRNDPAGGSTYVLGMTPGLALYLLGILPLAVIASLIYALIFDPGDIEEMENEFKTGEAAK